MAYWTHAERDNFKNTLWTILTIVCWWKYTTVIIVWSEKTPYIPVYETIGKFDHAMLIIACFSPFFSLHKNSDIQVKRSSSIIWHWQCIFGIYYFWDVPCVHMHWYSIAFKINVHLHYERYNRKRGYFLAAVCVIKKTFKFLHFYSYKWRLVQG